MCISKKVGSLCKILKIINQRRDKLKLPKRESSAGIVRVDMSVMINKGYVKFNAFSVIRNVLGMYLAAGWRLYL